jgi:hypothetical protein
MTLPWLYVNNQAFGREQSCPLTESRARPSAFKFWLRIQLADAIAAFLY